VQSLIRRAGITVGWWLQSAWARALLLQVLRIDIKVPNLLKRGNRQIAEQTHIIENMKLKIKIAGTRVHDVVYRVFLLKNAMNSALPGLSTYKLG